MFKILKLLTTYSPSKRFQLECQLMLHYSRSSRFLRKRFQRRLYYIYGSEISYTAKIDPSVVFFHPQGIFIQSNVIIEKDCIIYQQVTLGRSFDESGLQTIGSGTKIGAGAKIIGGISIGRNCTIGANSVITRSVPDNSTVVGVNRILSNTSKSQLKRNR